MGQQCTHNASLPLARYDQKNDIAVGTAEAPVLEDAPRQPWPVASLDALREDGVVLIPNVISSTTAALLRDHLESKLAASLAAVASGAVSESDCFEPILCRKARHFISLKLEPQMVVDAVAEALRALAPFIRGMFECEEPMLAELAAIRSTEGAPRQPIHMDDNVSWSGPPHRLSAFVALQDISEQMGPTTFLPGTHASLEAHTAMESATKKAKLLRAGPIRLGTMPAGSCTLHNTGVLHAGGANHSSCGRWLFHMSFVPAHLAIAAIDDYKPMCQLGVHTLGELERGAIRCEDDDETKRLQALWTSLIEDEEVKGWKVNYDMNLWWSRVCYRFEAAVGINLRDVTMSKSS